VKENYRRFACSSCDFSISKIPGGRAFEIPEVESLLKDKVFGPVDGFRSKLGRPFMASLKITTEHKLEFDFGNSGSEADAEPVDFSGQESLGACPKCKASVYAHGTSYVCEKSVGPEAACNFKTGMMILQQAISSDQVKKLLETGKTDLLDGFVSARTRRKFKAYLVKTPEGKIGFEFEARPAKPAKAQTSKKAEGSKTSKSSRSRTSGKAA
jgi:DNA topoisomerase-3